MSATPHPSPLPQGERERERFVPENTLSTCTPWLRNYGLDAQGSIGMAVTAFCGLPSITRSL